MGLSTPRESKPVSVLSLQNKTAGGATTIRKGQTVLLGTGKDECVLADAAAEPAIGVALEDIPPDKFGGVECGAGARVLAKVGGNITLGARLTADTDGDLIVTTNSGDVSILLALETGADGDLIEALHLGARATVP